MVDIVTGILLMLEMLKLELLGVYDAATKLSRAALLVRANRVASGCICGSCCSCSRYVVVVLGYFELAWIMTIGSHVLLVVALDIVGCGMVLLR